MENKIKFRDLSGWLKLAVVLSYIVGGFYVFTFSVGFIMGLFS